MNNFFLKTQKNLETNYCRKFYQKEIKELQVNQ